MYRTTETRELSHQERRIGSLTITRRFGRDGWNVVLAPAFDDELTGNPLHDAGLAFRTDRHISRHFGWSNEASVEVSPDMAAEADWIERQMLTIVHDYAMDRHGEYVTAMDVV